MTAPSATDAGVKVDGAVIGRLAQVPDGARTLERRGYDGCWTAEINHDPFLPLTLAAEHTSRVDLGTGIAVAFARNPMTVAQVGWDLQEYSQGRFLLGLGSQIKPHIERRFSMPWDRPVARMREFVAAMRAIWACWRDGSPLRFEGDFYTHSLMTPMFVPPAHAYADPGVFLAAVGDRMTEMCGEVADGLLAHAFSTERYLREVTIPTLTRGLERAGRQRTDIEVASPLFVVTGRDEAELAAAAVGRPHARGAAGAGGGVGSLTARSRSPWWRRSTRSPGRSCAAAPGRSTVCWWVSPRRSGRPTSSS